MNSLLESRAAHYAGLWHHLGNGDGAPTFLKYTGAPYIVHCAEVAEIVRTVPGHTMDMLAAAWTHDVLEDTFVGQQRGLLLSKIGPVAFDLVVELTDVTTLADGNRAERKAIERERIARISASAKTIKLADLVSNTRCIVKHDKKFAEIYLREKAALLNVLRGGDHDLWMQAFKVLSDAWGQVFFDESIGVKA